MIFSYIRYKQIINWSYRDTYVDLILDLIIVEKNIIIISNNTNRCFDLFQGNDWYIIFIMKLKRVEKKVFDEYILIKQLRFFLMGNNDEFAK